MPPAPRRQPRPGWYADPRGSEDFRWWDGAAWTSWLADSEYAPRPRGHVARLVPVPVLASPRSPRWFFAGLGAACLALVLTIVSLIGQGLPQPSRPYLAAKPADLGTPERIYRPYQFGVRDGERVVVIYERLKMTVPPGMPLEPEITKVTTVLRSATLVSAPTGSSDLVAILLLGDAEPDVVVAGDARATAERVLPAFLARYNQGGGGTAERVRLEPWPQVPGAVRLTGYFRYQTPTAGAQGDDIMMIVAPWTQAEYSGMGVWISVVPENASPEAKAMFPTTDPPIRLIE